MINWVVTGEKYFKINSLNFKLLTLLYNSMGIRRDRRMSEHSNTFLHLACIERQFDEEQNLRVQIKHLVRGKPK